MENKIKNYEELKAFFEKSFKEIKDTKAKIEKMTGVKWNEIPKKSRASFRKGETIIFNETKNEYEVNSYHYYEIKEQLRNIESIQGKIEDVRRDIECARYSRSWNFEKEFYNEIAEFKEARVQKRSFRNLQSHEFDEMNLRQWCTNGVLIKDSLIARIIRDYGNNKPLLEKMLSIIAKRNLRFAQEAFEKETKNLMERFL